MPKEENDEPKQAKKVEEQPEPPKDEPEQVVKEDVTTLAPAAATTGKKKFDLKAFLRTKKGKIVAGIVAFVLVVAVVFAVPASRYAVAGLVIKKDVTVELVDAETGKPVSAADVSLAGQTYKTDANGKATFKAVAVGDYKVTSKKNYYQDGTANTNVPILRNPDTVKLSVTATGRQVPVSVTNKITGKAIAGVEIFAGDSTAKTTDTGEATIVLPADKQTVNATFKVANYNDLTADITVTEQTDDKNKFAMTQNGKVYFLSKRTGKLNVMSSNLDGSDAKIVVEGTGKENTNTTVLLASRDWKHLALLANRDSDQQKLYHINTADGKLSVMDEGNKVGFSPVGWYNDQFIYKVNREDLQAWQPKRQSLKSFNATTAKIATIDDTNAAGSNVYDYQSEFLDNVYILENQIVYTKYWNRSSGYVTVGAKDGIYSAKPNGDNKQTLKEFENGGSGTVQARLYRPQEVYYRVNVGNKTSFYELEDGKITDAKTDDASFYGDYPTYLVSPSSKMTLWSEDRDGKQVTFVGDTNGANGKELIVSDKYKAYGWYTDDYILVSKDGSQLYIIAADGSTKEPVKVTDYHRPSYNFYGYGYGYGGL